VNGGEGEGKTGAAQFGIARTVELPYMQAVARAREELSKEGFGVLTEIDVRDTIKKKLGKDFRRYIILGACNPPLAHRALSADLDIGLLLPCNVAIYEVSPEASMVAAFDPMSVTERMPNNEEIASVAREVRRKMARVLEALG
jgi:uncharacterized protein (DUF302 family)